MKKLLLFALAMLISWAGFSQRSSLYYDDFEDYAVGDFIAEENPTWWMTWSNNPGSGEDGVISDDFASSPTKSVKVYKATGVETDLILKLGNKTAGAYEVNWDMYVETGYAGYYNFQHFESPGIQWAFEVYMLTNGNGQLYAGSSTPFAFTYPKDIWFEVRHVIDIDNDWIELFINGVNVHNWPFSYQAGSTTGANQLGGVDFYAGAVTGEVPRYYFDNVDYKPIASTLYSEDFESYNIGDYICVENPDWWKTWSNAPGTAEDALIVDDQASSPTKSLRIDKVPGETDILLKLGDKTSGSYDLNWEMYVETGYAGYYNIQHFESPGIQWAYEVYLLANGTGQLYAGSNTPYTFSYPKNTWFLVENFIDIDADWVELYIDGVLIHAWPFHYQAGGTTGENQLGAVNFYAGAVTGETPKYYLDDINFLQLAGPVDPIISVDPATISVTAAQNTIATAPLTITNDGASDLQYDISIIYPMALQKRGSISHETPSGSVRTLGYNTSADPGARPAPYNPVADNFVLHYDGDNYSAIGWSVAPISPTVAAMFPTNLTLPHAGMMLSSVDVYLNDPGTNFILKIWDMGNSYEPGTLLVSQPFTGQMLSWNNITLNDPVYITGADIWVGYQFTQPAPSTFIPGCDAGPANPNGDFLSTGVGWTHLSNNPDLNYNWNIRANLTGTPVQQWLSTAPTSGIVGPGGSEIVTVTCDATGLDEGTYEGILRIISNDPATPQLDVPVTFTVTEGGGVMVSVILDFEDIDDWSLTFGDWTAIDYDGGQTYGFENYSFPGNYDPMAFICFNPATTTPPMTGDPAIQPYGGEKFGACMASVPPPTNDDWLISPQTTLGDNSAFNFWVKSYTSQYGFEKYNVLISTTDMNQGSFTSLSGPTPLQAPTTWTFESYDISDYDGETVYLAIQCVSEDAFVFMVDDISIDFMVRIPEKPEAVDFTIYPNPVRDQLNVLSAKEMTRIDILNQLGQTVYSHVVKNNVFSMNTTGYSAGVYYIRVTTAEGVATKKVMIR